MSGRRRVQIPTRLSAGEAEIIRDAADEAGQSLNDWMAEALLDRAAGHAEQLLRVISDETLLREVARRMTPQPSRPLPCDEE